MTSKDKKLFFVALVLVLCCFAVFASGASLPAEEVDALEEIAKSLGKEGWNSEIGPCSSTEESSYVAQDAPRNSITCNCTYQSRTVCHVISIKFTKQNISGVLPPELVKLPYLQEFVVSGNYLNGKIPVEWGSFQNLERLDVYGNRLSGSISMLGNISTLRVLTLEANQFSGALPTELGRLVNLERLLLSSNSFSGELPRSLASLKHLTDLRISDNQFSGTIPNFIQSWKDLRKLEMQASGLQGPIPSTIASLSKLIDLRIGDINGTASTFPPVRNMKSLKKLLLRNCNLMGPIPYYIGGMLNLTNLDLSFNNFVGGIPSTFENLRNAKFIYLTSNMLSGTLPNWVLTGTHTLDLSYNNFSPWTSGRCQLGSVNLFGSSASIKNSSEPVPCLKNFSCPQRLLFSLHINCGGPEVTVEENHKSTTYSDDFSPGGASNFVQSRNYWAFSSTGDFLDHSDESYSYIASNTSMLLTPESQLYTKARLSPLSLTYYGFCLMNGKYIVKLHFAEIMFTDEKNYRSLGKRVFNVYIQGKMVLNDFNIKKEAGGSHRATVQSFETVVTANSLEIRFSWAGKGTISIPDRGTYGPLISAISVDPGFPVPLPHEGKISAGLVVAIVTPIMIVVLLILCLLWWKCRRGKQNKYQDLRGLDLQTGSFSLRHIKAATNNFDAANKIGEGGFGPVYKGVLADGTIIAVKRLSSKSKQGNREFVNEIGMISAIQHPNLVKLYGCCIEGNELLLVYEYMENNSLARALFGSEEQQLNLDWPTRHKICVGIARGLAYLHEESRLKIVHRDIKATNVLLDKDLNPKISDFGLAKLDEEEDTHMSTRVVGTMGYMAPEYAMHGYLTEKADVYSFGIVTLEIVSGKGNASYRPREHCIHLLDWAYVLQERGSLIELVDPKLGSDFKKEEAIGMLVVAILCTNVSATLRPSMSTVVSMLEGEIDIQNLLAKPNISSTDLRLRAMKMYRQLLSQQQSHSQEFQLAHNTYLKTSISLPTSSSTPAHELDPIYVDSQYLDGRE